MTRHSIQASYCTMSCFSGVKGPAALKSQDLGCTQAIAHPGDNFISDISGRSCSCCCCGRQVTSAVSNSVRPHRRQPIRLPRPWDSPGKDTGGGCHFLLQCTKVKSESEVAQSCLTLRNPLDCSLPGSVLGIVQARVLEWGATAFSAGQS